MGENARKACAEVFERPQGKASKPVDLRFRSLVGRAAWSNLPKAVQLRFSSRIGPMESAVYRGKVLVTRHSRLGWLLARLLRPVGAPLPLESGGARSALVSVSEHAPSGGQCWTRVYARDSGFPQTINSAKQFSGPTGLEEYLGCGIGMALTVEADEQGLVFRSDHYFLRIGKRRLRIPHWMGPGSTTVTHRDLGDSRFAFDLRLDHPLFGALVVQQAEFRDE
uniref:DUF4166 domain-containing protein n=1 Tax=Parerythrobacter lutipelagi TaxID=1964208 RepID=UPI0010F99326|nr:DUF4166 domain-containing protein [Parerythrobacter lutipelagi]